MKSTYFPLAVFCAASVLGCSADSVVGSAGAPEKYLAHPLDLASLGRTVSSTDEDFDPTTAGQLQPRLLLDAGATSNEVVAIALTSRHLYFAVSWEGIYRIPKHGGAVEVIDAGAMKSFRALGAAAKEVFWTKTSFGDRDWPHIEIKRREDEGGPTTLLFSGHWGVDSIQADATGLFFVGHEAGVSGSHLHLLPRTDGTTPRRLLKFQHDSSVWRRTVGQIFFTTPSWFSLRETEVNVLPDGQSEPRVLAVLPTATATVHDADASFVFVSGQETIWQISRANGAVTELAKGENIGPVAVDDERVYFVSSAAESGPKLHSTSRADGTNIVLASGIALAGLRRMAQDESLIYLLHASGHKVSVVAKKPTP